MSATNTAAKSIGLETSSVKDMFAAERPGHRLATQTRKESSEQYLLEALVPVSQSRWQSRKYAGTS